MNKQPANDAILQPGQVLDGEYEIIGRIGQSGMGVVYKARALALDRNVAIKMPLWSCGYLLHRPGTGPASWLHSDRFP